MGHMYEDKQSLAVHFTRIVTSSQFVNVGDFTANRWTDGNT